MCGTKDCTSVQVSNRLSQEPHLINLVDFLPQHIQEDLQLAMAIDQPGSEACAMFTAVHSGWVQRSHGTQGIIWDDGLGPVDVLRREQR